jgi:hypothetical protein
MRKAISVITFIAIFSIVNVYANEGWWTFTSTQISISQKDSNEKEFAILMTNVHFVPDRILSFANNSQMAELSSNYFMKNIVKPLGRYGLSFSDIATPIHQCRIADVQKEKDSVAANWQRCMDKIGDGFNVYIYNVDLENPLSLSSAKIKLVKKNNEQTAFLENAMRSK